MPQFQMVCTRCGTIGWPKRYTPGNFATELLLFLFFIIPGLIYGVWRLAARKDVCPACLSDALVPIDSPAGRALASRIQPQTVGPFCGGCGAPVQGRFCASCGTATGGGQFPPPVETQPLGGWQRPQQPAPKTDLIRRQSGRVTPIKVVVALIILWFLGFLGFVTVQLGKHATSSGSPNVASTTKVESTPSAVVHAGDIATVTDGLWWCGSTKEALAARGKSELL